MKMHISSTDYQWWIKYAFFTICPNQLFYVTIKYVHILYSFRNAFNYHLINSESKIFVLIMILLALYYT